MNAAPPRSLATAVATPLPVQEATTGAQDEKERFYRPELDGLRFFAFFAVYLNHTFLFGVEGAHHRLPNVLAHTLGTIGAAGAFGVDLFFVLSAYLITELLLRERRVTGALDAPAFYMRRVLRIWPLYFLFLAFAYALTFVLPDERLTAKHLFWFALFGGNWIYILKPVSSVAAPLWSVSVEEQFYILWPWAVRRGSIRRLVLIALGMVVVGVAVRFALARAGLNEPWVSKGSFTRVDGIAAGVLLAAVLQGRTLSLPGWARTALCAGGFGVLLEIAHNFHLLQGQLSVARITWGWPFAALGCTAIVVSVLGATGGAGAVLRHPVMIYLGRISYGLYVFHQVGLLVADRLFPEHATEMSQWAGRFVVGLGVTVALAAMSYRWIEKPFLRLKEKRFTRVHSR